MSSSIQITTKNGRLIARISLTFFILAIFIWLFLPYFVIPFSTNISLAMLKSLIVIMWIVFFIYINITPFYIYRAAPYLLSDSVFDYLLF